MTSHRPPGPAHSPRSDDHRLLCIAEIGCGPPYHGNRARMRSLLKACRDLGYEIHFAGVNMADVERRATVPHVDRWVADFVSPPYRPSLATRAIRRLRRAAGIAPGQRMRTHRSALAEVDQWFPPQWLEQTRLLQKRHDYRRVLVAYVFHSAFLTAFPPTTRRVLDCHDVFADRNQRLSSAGLGPEAGWFSVSPAAENAGLLRADVVIGIQQHESAYFRSAVEDRRVVRTVGHLSDVVALPFGPGVQHVVGYVGGPNPLNVAGFTRFARETWPAVCRGNPHVRLLVAGGICDHVDMPDRAQALGSIDDLADFYRRCAVTVNPVHAGTGLKIKTIEALAFGRACVTTPQGGEGIENLRGQGLEIAESNDEFVEAVLRYCGDSAAAESAGAAAARAVSDLKVRDLGELQLALDGPLTPPRS